MADVVRASGDPAQVAEAFVELARTLVGEFDVHELLQVLVDRCVDVLDVAAAGLLLADRVDDLQTMVASNQQARFLELVQVQHGEGPCLDCYRSGQPVAVDDLTGSLQRWPRFAPTAVDQGFGSAMALPMRVHGRVIGTLNLFGTEDQDPVATTSTRIAQAMADVAAIAIEHVQLAHERLTLITQLETALDSRTAIEQAKGVLASHLQISTEQAFTLLRQQARGTRRLLREVALETVNHGGRNFPDHQA